MFSFVIGKKVGMRVCVVFTRFYAFTRYIWISNMMNCYHGGAGFTIAQKSIVDTVDKNNVIVLNIT